MGDGSLASCEGAWRAAQGEHHAERETSSMLGGIRSESIDGLTAGRVAAWRKEEDFSLQERAARRFRVTTRGTAERVCARGDNDVYLALLGIEVTFLLFLGVVCSVQQCESGLQQRGADRATGAAMDSSCRHGARTFVPRGRVATRPAASEAR